MGAASCCNQVHNEGLVRSKEYTVPPKGVCLQEEALWKAYHFECQDIFRENPVLASDKGRQVLLFVKRSMPSLQREKEIGDL